MIKVMFLLFLMGCSNDLVSNNSVKWINNIIIDIDRPSNELYIQVETSENVDINLIDSIIVNLEYVGGVGLDYNGDFLIYDNGQNGDIIANNGIYTLIDQADKVDSPDEQSEIININFPSSFKLNSTDLGIIPFTITIKGKKYLATVSLFENNNVHTLEKYINVDNSSLGIQINKKDLYIDNPDTDICDRVSNTYGDIFYPITFDWPDATSTGFNNYFTYQSGFSVASINDCGSTGTSIFKFVLNDLDTGESISEEKSIISYGCGDGICEQDYENNILCPEDCNDE